MELSFPSEIGGRLVGRGLGRGVPGQGQRGEQDRKQRHGHTGLPSAWARDWDAIPLG